MNFDLEGKRPRHQSASSRNRNSLGLASRLPVPHGDLAGQSAHNQQERQQVHCRGGLGHHLMACLSIRKSTKVDAFAFAASRRSKNKPPAYNDCLLAVASADTPAAKL